ncbi:MAG: SDR family oxidoreductase [Pleurocapsa sp. MO_226.B13]|nr:SDR family oxidoreductase [Pleurocapsa sp. MO_226.B13]
MSINDRLANFIDLLTFQSPVPPYWIEIETKNPNCTYYFGDFKHPLAAKLMQQGYIQDLIEEMENPETLEDIDSARLGSIFSTNIFSMFYFCKAAIPHLKEGSAIINTTSINAYKGNAPLLSYSTTKGAILAFTRSLSQSLLKKGIRVNGVAPGPIWTPFIPDAFDAEQVEGFGKQVPMQRPGQPVEGIGSISRGNTNFLRTIKLFISTPSVIE